MLDMLEDRFRLAEHGTTVRTEVTAGVTTFLTMAYIVFVNPAVLTGSMFGSETGMDFGAVTTATCLAAALATAIMGLYARYPIAQASGMGGNFLFVLTVIPAAAATGHPHPWKVALGVVFVAGVAFLIISATGLRTAILRGLSRSMQNGIAVGIGLFIAFIGLRNAGVIVTDADTAVTLNTSFASPDLAVFAAGLLATAILRARGVRAAILWGIGVATAASLILEAAIETWPSLASSPQVAGSLLVERFEPATRIVSAPPSLAPTFLQMDVGAALSATMLPLVVVFLVMDVFDTLGTLVGVSEQAGLMEDGRLPRARRAMLSDAVGTVAGAGLGTSTVTSYVESAAGVEQGGRTGLTSVTTAGLFLLAPVFTPLVAMIGSYPPITAPALVVVGAMMCRNATKVDWEDASESIPAFLVILGIPLTYSIADGLALGIIVYPVVKVAAGRRRDVHGTMYPLAAFLLLYFILLRG